MKMYHRVDPSKKILRLWNQTEHFDLGDKVDWRLIHSLALVEGYFFKLHECTPGLGFYNQRSYIMFQTFQGNLYVHIGNRKYEFVDPVKFLYDLYNYSPDEDDLITVLALRKDNKIVLEIKHCRDLYIDDTPENMRELLEFFDSRPSPTRMYAGLDSGYDGISIIAQEDYLIVAIQYADCNTDILMFKRGPIHTDFQGLI